MATGLYKVKNGWANQDSVKVRYSDDSEMDVSAEQYVAQGYKPDLSELKYVE